MTSQHDFSIFLNALLEPTKFQDYGPNGLQVEGKREIRTLVSGVTASVDLIDAAIAQRADAVVVHHGLFWRGQDGCVTGWMRQRLKRLLAHDINLYAYHLPLDAHPELGNNAQLGRLMGWTALDGPAGRFGAQNLGWIGHSAYADVDSLSEHLSIKLNRPVTTVSASLSAIKKIAWCTGGAQSYFEAAIAAGVDAFVTGEISEPQAHYAREMGVAYLACGHHATERYGVQAVAAHAAQHFGLVHQFIDIDNPA
jgi:dinuclear metal center YbgI/SA1388 family protein